MGTRTLAAVPSPAGRTAPRTYEEIVHAIYNDERASLGQRELLLAVAYAVCVADRDEGVSPLREARRVLGRECSVARYDRLVRADVPRYEAPTEAGDWGPSNAPSCEAPRLRPYRPRLPLGGGGTRDWRTEDGVCGAQSHLKVIEKDPCTGWVIGHWFCRRHAEHAERVAEQVRKQNAAAPDPVPNTGGLLPCYFKADWEKVYRHYAGKCWAPPKYGLCADDWPTPGETFQAHRRLRMVFAGARSGQTPDDGAF